MRIASSKKVNYMFEASVGGGIPIIRPMIQCLSANEIEDIYGIMNGTTNYVLTKMFEDGLSFEKALSDAQMLGFAESDPADVEGYDAARKICILSSWAGRHVSPEQVHCEGILISHWMMLGVRNRLRCQLLLGRYVE